MRTSFKIFMPGGGRLSLPGIFSRSGFGGEPFSLSGIG